MDEGEGNFRFDKLQPPGDRFQIGELIGCGAFSEVFLATDTQTGNKRVAVKTLLADANNFRNISEEYRVLKKLSTNPLIPEFQGVYLKKSGDSSTRDHLWFVMELCENGPVIDLVRNLQRTEKNMSEEHIAYVLKETIKGLLYLHENKVTHGDVKGSNILITKNGEVKLAGFGFSKFSESADDSHNVCEGSPGWMAPEVASCVQNNGTYDNRIDVWAIGITAIELSEGKSPFEDIHPTRALFQIVRNPPPTLYRPDSWTELFNDFISECLQKNPEYRPHMLEIVEHPFITEIPDNDYHELKSLAESFKTGRPKQSDVAVRNNLLFTGRDETPQPMLAEDLAALDNLSEERIVNEIQDRFKLEQYYTFVGDVLLAVNPNEHKDIYSSKEHEKYRFKARSDNAPHIYAVADKAYQDVLHNHEPQMILLSGESLSGKTTQFNHLLNHLLYLSDNENKIGTRIKKAMSVLHAVGNAGTPVNPNSTRHVLKLELTFTGTGKLSGAIFWIYQLEKWRVFTSEMSQANFHLFYYFYDAMDVNGNLEKYHLKSGREYRYLRSCDNGDNDRRSPREIREGNSEKFSEFIYNLECLGFTLDQQETLKKLIAAILLLGEVKFRSTEEKFSEVENAKTAFKVAKLLDIEEKKFVWSLTNYCIVEDGTAERRQHTKSEAESARDVLAAGIYSRIVDWIVNIINLQLSFSRAVLGDKYSINIMDLFGFECFTTNSLEQLFVNTLNEQMQYHYVQRAFAWEMQEQEEEEIPLQPLNFYDNKPTVDELLSKPEGLFYILDEATHNNLDFEETIQELGSKKKGPRIKNVRRYEFCVAHYTGRVVYSSKGLPEKNYDFLPPEMIEAMRLSTNHTIQSLFTGRLTRTGNLTITASEQQAILSKSSKCWESTILTDSKIKIKKYNTESRGQYSQTKQMRTAAATFRATSLELLRSLAIGTGSGSTHFVRCIRTDLRNEPKGFHKNIVLQQLRALAVLDTARARKKGYPHRITFSEFLRRYKFLAFEFNESVEVSKENSRLLLVRLKMEGWVIGKSKVFLTYYNEEYLSRLYETNVKKIIKVQTMIRVFLAKRNFASKLLKKRRDSVIEAKSKEIKNSNLISEEKAAITIQKQYRGHCARKHYKNLYGAESDVLDTKTCEFIQKYWNKWKAKTIFQVLLMYRAAKHQDVIYFSQQVHLYNQKVVTELLDGNKETVKMDKIDPGSKVSLVLPKKLPCVWKLPFRLDDVSFIDTDHMCYTAMSGKQDLESEIEAWDAPLRRETNTTRNKNETFMKDEGVQTSSSPPQTLNKKHYKDSLNCIDMKFMRDVDSMYEEELLDDKRAFPSSAEFQENVKDTRQLTYITPVKDVKKGTPNAGIYKYKRNKIAAENKSPAIPPKKVTGIKVVPEYNYNNDFYRFTDAENNQVQTLLTRSPTDSMEYMGPLCQSKNFYNRQTNLKIHGNPNPIVEMKMKGQVITVTKDNKDEYDHDNDDPPFNFQAMLRKTNNRMSIKRNELNLDNKKMSEVIVPKTYMTENNKNKSGPPSVTENVIYCSNAKKQGSHVPAESASKNQDMKQEKIIEEDTTTTITILAPGIVIQGQVSEL